MGKMKDLYTEGVTDLHSYAVGRKDECLAMVKEIESEDFHKRVVSLKDSETWADDVVALVVATLLFSSKFTDNDDDEEEY